MVSNKHYRKCASFVVELRFSISATICAFLAIAQLPDKQTTGDLTVFAFPLPAAGLPLVMASWITPHQQRLSGALSSFTRTRTKCHGVCGEAAGHGGPSTRPESSLFVRHFLFMNAHLAFSALSSAIRPPASLRFASSSSFCWMNLLISLTF